MQPIPVRIARWAFWQNRAGTASLITDQTPRNAPEDATGIDARDLARGVAPGWRRRLDLFGRAACEVLGHALEGVENPKIVFTSRHGNIDRTLRLLGDIARAETPSPADFSMSVHNALVGVASINWSVTASHTAIAAGPDSFLAGITESVAQLVDTPDDPVILIYIDLPLPDVYAAFDPTNINGTAFAVRLHMDNGKDQTGIPAARFHLGPLDRDRSQNLAANDANPPLPYDQVRHLQTFLIGTSPSCIVDGTNQAWQITRDA
jgi:hypothetical protein